MGAPQPFPGVTMMATPSKVSMADVVGSNDFWDSPSSVVPPQVRDLTFVRSLSLVSDVGPAPGARGLSSVAEGQTSFFVEFPNGPSCTLGISLALPALPEAPFVLMVRQPHLQ